MKVFTIKINPVSQSYGLRPGIYGLSHGLTKCPPDTWLHQSADWCRPFKSRSYQKKKDIRKDVLFFWCARRDLKVSCKAGRKVHIVG